MTALPLILLGTAETAFMQCLAEAASELDLPCLRLTEATDAPLCRFALACDDGQVVAAARLNDRNCSGGLSVRVAAQLQDPESGRMMLSWMLGLPVQPAAAATRIDRIGLLLTPGRAQVIWRSESRDGEDFIAHADTAARLVGVALRTDWRNAKGWGRGLVCLTAADTPQGYGLIGVRHGLPPDLLAIAAAGLQMPWRDLLTALLENAPLCLTPPAPVVAVDAVGRVRLRDRLAA